MAFVANRLYHVYNRGNNAQPLFYEERNYRFFQTKLREYLSEACDVLAYCLMPNHYHILLHTHEEGLRPVSNTSAVPKLSRKLGTLQSSYTQAINKQEGRTGSLFQQKAKQKEIEEYGFTCFQYIHQNPVKARLCLAPEDWEFSSFNDYYRPGEEAIANTTLAHDLLDIELEPQAFYMQSRGVIRDEDLRYFL